MSNLFVSEHVHCFAGLIDLLDVFPRKLALLVKLWLAFRSIFGIRHCK